MPAQAPKLTIQLSLSSTTYSYSNPIPPTLSLTVTTDSTRPVTLLTYNTPFHPRSGMTHKCFSIRDLTTNEEVQTSSIRVQRLPLSRARGCSDEQYFLTLQPFTSTTVSTRFASGNEEMRPRSRAVAQQEWEESIKNRTARRSAFACGVDGLEPGHRYTISVAKASLMSLSWKRGTKDDILVDSESKDWNVSAVQWEESALDIEYGEAVDFLVEQ